MTVIKSAPPLVRDVPKPNFPDQLCDLRAHCNEVVASRVTAQLTSSVLAAISSATESAQRAIDAANASASSVIESVLSATRSTSSALASTSITVRSTSHVAESTSLVGDSVNSVSHGLDLSAGQLAGIVVGVFFLSSFSSILITYLMLRYRRQGAGIPSSLDPSGEAKRQWPWQSFGKSGGDANLTRRPTNTRFGRHQSGNRFLSKLRPEISHLTHLKSPVNENLFPSPLGPGSISDQIFPVSPLSEEQINASVREHSPSLRLAIFGHNSQRNSRSEILDAAPIKYTLSRNTTQSGTRQMQLVRVGSQGTDPRYPPNIRTRNTFPSSSRTPSLSSPPIIPLRFSSLNAYTAPPLKDPSNYHGGDGTFLFLTDDESTEPAPGPSRDEARSESSQSSIIGQDLTQFDPGGGVGQQPVSRFSVSSVPGSLDYSVSSDSPMEQPDQPEVSPLRPAPPSPSQLQAPVPRRLHLASSAGVSATFYAWDSSDPETYGLPGNRASST